MTTPEQGFDPHHLQGQYAGFVTRLIAFLIDLLILSVMYSVVTVAVQAIGGFFQQDLVSLAREETFAGVIAGFIASLFPLTYYTFFWALTGQTPGKAFMGVRIYTLEGKRMSLRRAFVRYLSYFLSAGLLFSGFFLVLVDNRRQGLHDKFARTVVVYAWEARIHRLVTERARRGIIPRE